MVVRCNSVCDTDKRFGKNSRYYEKGIKYCSYCTKKVMTKEIRCPCCKTVLRVRTHRNKTLAKIKVKRVEV